MAKRYHVTPSDDARWIVRQSNTSRAIKVFDRKSDAVQAAKDIARRMGANVVIHGRDGRIQHSDTYPLGYGILKGQYVVRKGIDLSKPIYKQATKRSSRRRI